MRGGKQPSCIVYDDHINVAPEELLPGLSPLLWEVPRSVNRHDLRNVLGEPSGGNGRKTACRHNDPVYPAGSIILPGLKIPSGSKACFTSRICSNAFPCSS